MSAVSFNGVVCLALCNLLVELHELVTHFADYLYVWYDLSCQCWWY